jgi:uncharacterized membrane protein
MQMIKEIKIYFLLLILLSVPMHFSAWTDHPLEHFQSLSDSSLGGSHPFVITFIVYLLILLFRFLWKLVIKTASRSK